MMFSSFDPEICRALRERQNSVAVLFLFCGNSLHADERRNSTAMALEFAVRHQLQVLSTSARKGPAESRLWAMWYES